MSTGLPAGATGTYSLRLVDIWKSFGGVTALKGVSFEVSAGKVHALLGENGAGKSTLMSIAAGALVPDRGYVEIAGARLARPSPRQLAESGVAIVYQSPAVMRDLTIRENLLLAMPRRLRPPRARAAAWVQERLATVHADLDPQRPGSSLTAAQRQLVEIAKAVAIEPRVLILDEPTAVLTPDQTGYLFDLIRRLAGAGTSVVYISHRIPEIKQIADTATLLRDGEDCGTFDLETVSDAQILEALTRGAGPRAAERMQHAVGEPVLVASGLSGDGLQDVSFDLRPGEILGLGGVSGNGQSAAIRALAGLSAHTGSVTVDSHLVWPSSPPAARRAGIAYVPADRQNEGIFPSLSVRENVTVQTVAEHARAGVINAAAERRTVAAGLEQLSVRTASQEADITSLSGGNQQKVVLTRSLLAHPRVLLCEEPTQGVDVGTRAEIHRMLRQRSADNTAVAVLSSDAHELAELCDRVAIFSRGRIAQVLAGSDLTEPSITRAAMTSTQERTGATGTHPARWSRLLSALRSPSATTLLLAALIALIGVFTAIQHPTYSSAFNISGVLFLASILAIVSLGELPVLISGGIDFSVGPLMAVTVVVLSYFEGAGASPGRRLAGFLVVLAIGVLAGLLHTVLIRRMRIAPIITTVATYIGFQGLALVIRATPGGPAFDGFAAAVEKTFGYFPVVFIAAVLLTVLGEFMLRQSRFGMSLRAVGSNERHAFRVGVRTEPVICAAYVLCSMLAVCAGILLFAQVGEGVPTAGISYSLDAITAVVIGGASIYGGRGSFIGATVGAVLLTQMLNVIPFLGLSVAWQFWFPGVLIIVAGAAFGASSGSTGAPTPGIRGVVGMLRTLPFAGGGR